MISKSGTPKHLFRIFTGICALFISGFTAGYSAEKQFTSGLNKVSLIELYTSEGCSSCPPAEKWMASLKDQPNLWKDFVPVAFHVDYWDYIGWKDPFASSEYGLRQRHYRQLGNIRTVYTPGMILDGREWRNWYSNGSVNPSEEAVGNLDVAINNKVVTASFSPVATEKSGEWEINVAVLGFKLVSNVDSGENSGRTLEQEFVVLGYTKAESKNGKWQIPLPDIKEEYAKHTGLAVWVNVKGEQTPIQATGGWL